MWEMQRTDFDGVGLCTWLCDVPGLAARTIRWRRTRDEACMEYLLCGEKRSGKERGGEQSWNEAIRAPTAPLGALVLYSGFGRSSRLYSGRPCSIALSLNTVQRINGALETESRQGVMFRNSNDVQRAGRISNVGMIPTLLLFSKPFHPRSSRFEANIANRAANGSCIHPYTRAVLFSSVVVQYVQYAYRKRKP